MESAWTHERFGNWRFRTRPSITPHAWYGEAKQDDFKDERGGPWEPGQVWFEFGDSHDDVVTKLKREVFH